MVTAGLLECDVGVVEVGMAVTPTIARAIAEQDADAGIAITTSHNPPADTSIKLWTPSWQAFDGGSVVGIDRPAPGYALELLRALRDERPSLTAAGALLSNTASVTTHALACRVAATIADRTSIHLEVDAPTTHDVDRSDAPADQAADEEKQASRSRAFANAFVGTSTTRPDEIEDETRERHMATRLATLAGDDRVEAVVGIDHLDAIVDETVSTKPVLPVIDAAVPQYRFASDTPPRPRPHLGSPTSWQFSAPVPSGSPAWSEHSVSPPSDRTTVT